MGLWIGLANPVTASSVVTEIRGVEGDMLANVQASVGLVQAQALEDVSVWRLRQLTDHARTQVQAALQPFGYYQTNVFVRLDPPEQPAAPWHALIEIELGEPVRVAQLNLEWLDDEQDLDGLEEWSRNWPLPVGSILRHPEYERSLRQLDYLAEAEGYFTAQYESRWVEVDAARNQARIDVQYRPGPRYVVGQIEVEQAGFTERLIER
ncbi:MAG: POTRA domain-containing protein, partial [Pseudomonadota bacterium]